MLTLYDSIESPLFSIVRVMLSVEPPCSVTLGVSSDKIIVELAVALLNNGVDIADSINTAKKIARNVLRDIRPSQANMTSLLSESDVLCKNQSIITLFLANSIFHRGEFPMGSRRCRLEFYQSVLLLQ